MAYINPETNEIYENLKAGKDLDGRGNIRY